MITLSYKNVNDPDFNDALETLDRCTVFSVKTLCSFNKLKKTWDAEKATARELFAKVIEKYTEMETVSEGDKIVTKPKMKTVDGKVLRCFTDEKAMDAAAKELLEQKFEVQIHPFTLTELMAAKLSPKQVRALEPIIKDEDASAPRLVKG